MCEADEQISLWIRAKFPIINIVTYEENRVLTQLLEIRNHVIQERGRFLRQQLERAEDDDERAELENSLERLKRDHQVLVWSCTTGLLHWSHFTEDERGVATQRERSMQLPIDSSNPVAVLQHLNRGNLGDEDNVDFSSAIYVFRDIHPWLDREDRAGRFNHMLVRSMRDVAQRCVLSPVPRCMILLAPKAVVPHELNKDIRVIDYPLPTFEQLDSHFRILEPVIQRKYGEGAVQLNEDSRQALIQALRGLTYSEARNVLAKSLANNGELGADDVREVLVEKRQIIQKDGILEYIESDVSNNQIGGLELLMDWLKHRRLAFYGYAFEYENEQYSLPVPKGILMIGVPGGGKSLVAKTIGAAWELPLLRLDTGRIFGGIVGQSEENMRRAIAVAESVAPCCVWLDEIEKAFPKTSGATDSGVSLRVMNTFLTWMQERKENVFIVATGNDISQMPPELTRKGRFDEIFYVGLPDRDSRRAIWQIHTQGLPLQDVDLDQLADRTRWFTGAEIEQVVKNARYRLSAFLDGDTSALSGNTNQKPLMGALLASVKDLVPLARRKGDDGRALLAKTLEQAEQLATKASRSFESLPERPEQMTEPDDPGGPATRSDWNESLL